nr:unnamed protein product [Callosobruchus analis]
MEQRGEKNAALLYLRDKEYYTIDGDMDSGKICTMVPLHSYSEITIYEIDIMEAQLAVEVRSCIIEKPSFSKWLGEWVVSTLLKLDVVALNIPQHYETAVNNRSTEILRSKARIEFSTALRSLSSAALFPAIPTCPGVQTKTATFLYNVYSVIDMKYECDIGVPSELEDTRDLADSDGNSSMFAIE